jgi:cytochrome c553
VVRGDSEKHSPEAGSVGRLIEELRQAASGLSDEQRDRLAHHLEEQEPTDGEETRAD